MVKTKKEYRSYDEVLVEKLQNDPELAQIFLQDAFEEYKMDNDLKVLMYAIWAYGKAHGINELAKKSKMNRQKLYRTFTRENEPSWKTMESLIKGVGFEISFQPQQIPKR